MTVNQTRAELAELAAVHADARATLQACRDRLHAAVLAAVDAGEPIGTVAAAIGVTKPRVYAIIAQTAAG